MGDFYERTKPSVSLFPPGRAWRPPQAGGLGALISHWSLNDAAPALVSIPTGAGKTGIGLAAPYLTKTEGRVLVLVPKRDLRKQMTDAFRTQRLLRTVGVLPEGAPGPEVMEVTGLIADWGAFESADVVVALPHSISPVHYGEGNLPPKDLFDLIVVDEAHHAPARMWRELLDYFAPTPALLLTATPRRRDGRSIPGTHIYNYPLRIALEEGFYKPIIPMLLDPGADRLACDRTIAKSASELLGDAQHATSVLMVRAATIQRLHALQEIYRDLGVDLTLLHYNVSDTRQREIVDGMRDGTIRAVGVVSMLGEGFDLSAIRLLAYHDKHKSMVGTAQLIGRLARVDDRFPQPSTLITVRDGEVYPQLQGALFELYQEDSDWATLLPQIVDAEVEEQRQDQQFVAAFPAQRGEIAPGSLRPLARAVVYETLDGWEPGFAQGELPPELQVGAIFAGGTVVYSVADAASGLMVIVVRYTVQPRWSSDPALADMTYELHVAGFRRPAQVGLPSLLFLNLQREGRRRRVEELLDLDDHTAPAGPELLGGYLDSLTRLSVSSVGIRSTNAAARGRASYRNFMGSGVDRGLRSVDMARSALGHVMFQIKVGSGAANAGGAVEKSKVWWSRYMGLRELSDWVDETANLLWFPVQNPQGPLLPGMERGERLTAWPGSPPLAAELHPALFGLGLELYGPDGVLGGIEDLELHVNDDPTGTLVEVDGPVDGRLRMLGVFNDRAAGVQRLVFDGTIGLDGRLEATLDLEVRRGFGVPVALSELLADRAPSVYFLDGSTTIGALIYPRQGVTSLFDLRLLEGIDWPGVDPTAETRATAEGRGVGVRSVHEHLEEVLLAQPRRGSERWVLHNDGAGEIADYIVLEELASGEVALGLWHAKGAANGTVSVRVGDMQVVVAQAIRSRRSVTSTNLWEQIGRRLDGTESPVATLVEGSDSPDVLRRRLGLEPSVPGDPEPWTVRQPVVSATIGIAQPGLGAALLRTQLATAPVPPAAQSIRELFSVLSDTAISDGAELRILISE